MSRKTGGPHGPPPRGTSDDLDDDFNDPSDDEVTLIESYEPGQLKAGGIVHHGEVLVLPHGVRGGWRRESPNAITGPDLKLLLVERPDYVVFGTGPAADPVAEVSDEAAAVLDGSGIEWAALPTPQAVERYNETAPRKHTVAALILSLLVALLAMAVPARAQGQGSLQTAPDKGYRFRNAPLASVLMQVQSRTGHRFQVDRTTGLIRVTLDTDPIPVDRLVNALAGALGLDVSTIGDLTVISSRTPAPEPEVDDTLLEGIWRLESGDYRYRKFRNDMEKVAEIQGAEKKDPERAAALERELPAEWREYLGYRRSLGNAAGAQDALRAGRAYIGVNLGSRGGLPQTDEFQGGLEGWDGFGAVVTDLVPGSPAEGSGLQKGDVILRANNFWVEAPSTLIRLVSRTSVGDEILLWVVRKGRLLQMNVLVGEREPENPAR